MNTRFLPRAIVVPVCVFAVLITVQLSSALAQFDKGQIAGFVHDQKGAVVPGAVVKITNTLTRIEHAATTDDSGYYIHLNLAPGDYEILVEAPGFKKFTQTAVT